MARLIDADDIDFSAYERENAPRMKVRPAALFADQLEAAFAPREHGARRPRMSSTKMRHCIEFRPGETTVWAGYNGHRKSLVTGQTMIDLCAQGERVMAMSLEMLPGMTLARQCRQAFGTATPSARQREAFMRWTDDRLWLFDHLGHFAPKLCLAALRYFADKVGGHHAFIDSMMMVCESEESMDEQKALVTNLVRIAQETGLHIHLVAHCRKPGDDESKPPTKYQIRGSAAISDQVHNIVTVWANKAKKAEIEAKGAKASEDTLAKPDALLSVEKQRNGAFEGKLGLWFDEASFRFTDERTTPIEPFPIEDDLDFAA